ncbi:DUF3987 domain-containing protein [Lacinutrix himadriensis]|uniref:DUF3987 domain-containing protein n=1 Tax=Lacinutrix himadriensis TaxID=641549 RepID=UPI0006E3BECD|nr:DUF3987 domain-containing protein [Lacinutrix himadriensis]
MEAQKNKIDLNKVIDSEIQKNKNSFPLDVFPKTMQNLIENANETVMFNREYFSAGILSACATAIGNSSKLFNGSYFSKAIFWLIIVGRSGIGKTHPLVFAMQPIEYKDKMAYNDFKNDLKEFENQENKTNKPKYNKHILKDFTPEKLAETLQNNEKGVAIYKDELLGWINSFDQYKKGGDQQLYLELFNGGILTVDRVTKDSIRVEETNVNILGGLQPKLLKNLGKNGRNDDGFLSRFLFVYPKEVKPRLFTGKSIETVHVDNYKKLIANLYDAPARNFKVSQSVIEIFKKWQHEKSKESFNDDLEMLTQSKLESYVWRLALILECINQADRNECTEEISDKSIKDAIRLVEYFRINAFRVYDEMLDNNPLNQLPINKLDLYKELPIEFKRKDVLPLFERFKINGGSIDRFLKSELFSNPNYGYYKKKYTTGN